jgi:LPXTG-motif cell wall-anchored protein
MRKQILPLFFLSLLFLVFLFVNPAYAKKPPWAGGGGGGPHNPPPSAPEPLSITLIGMGASGAVGYFLGKRKKK